MANHMSASEAWEIVRDETAPIRRNYGSDEGYMADKARYARACAIVAALVEAHRSLDELSDYDVPIKTAKVRALERGDEMPKVTTRGEAQP